MAGKPRRLYSFAEAVDAAGQVVKRAEKPLTWGGPRSVHAQRQVRAQRPQGLRRQSLAAAACGDRSFRPHRRHVRFRE